MTTDIQVPPLGESVTEATVAKWFKAEGDSVSLDEPLVELETDKVALEVNASAAGALSKIIAAEGETVEVGALLGQIDEGSEGAKPAAKKEESKKEEPKKAEAKKEEPKKEEAKKEEAKPEPKKAEEKPAEPVLSPAARRVVEEENLEPSKIEGTGKDGRVTKEDAVAAAEAKKSEPAPAQKPAEAKSKEPKPVGEREERVPMTRLRKRIAERLKEAQNTAAMLTTFNEVDMTAVMDLRSQHKDIFEKKHGVRLGFMSFFVKACVNALKELPAVNAEIDGDDIVYKNHYDIGIAVSAPNGLVVPVVRDCDAKGFADIEKEINAYGQKARDGNLALGDLQGGTFTITNGGVFGSLMSTPIINPPQSAILGMHAIKKRAVVVDDAVVVRPMMYLALSYDHRLIDGREAVTFLVRIKEAIEEPQRLLLDI
jgi:2-oxoglutarate dehydrogenase E2 component (dihydrolipoamide succinyltransferase)